MAPPAATHAGFFAEVRVLSMEHLVLVVTCASIVICLCGVGLHLRHQSEAREQRFRKAVGAGTLLFTLCMHLWWCLPQNFTIEKSLPLHFCDVAAVLSPLALLTALRPIRVVAYFWAFALGTQAFISPVESAGPMHWPFWTFWGSHLIIVGLAAYDVVVGRFRPVGRDLGLAILVTAAYASVLLLIDVPFHLNYGYVGDNKPEVTTIIDALGPWPLRLIPLVALVMVAFSVVYLPWLVRDLAARRADAHAPNIAPSK